MKNYNYSVTTILKDGEIIVKTDSAAKAAQAFIESVGDDLTCEMVSGITGEVLACKSNEMDYCSEEMLPLMIVAAMEKLGEALLED